MRMKKCSLLIFWNVIQKFTRKYIQVAFLTVYFYEVEDSFFKSPEGTFPHIILTGSLFLNSRNHCQRNFGSSRSIFRRFGGLPKYFDGWYVSPVRSTRREFMEHFSHEPHFFPTCTWLLNFSFNINLLEFCRFSSACVSLGNFGFNVLHEMSSTSHFPTTARRTSACRVRLLSCEIM